MALDIFIHNTEPSVIPNPQGDQLTVYRNRNIARVAAPVGAKYIVRFSDGFEEELSGGGNGAILAPARLASTGNVNLAASPANFDGVPAVAGDRILINNQAIPSENGVYIFNGAGNALTRAADFNATSDPAVTAGMLITVTEGNTLADTLWELATNNPILIGASNIVFIEIPAPTSPVYAVFYGLNAGTDNGGANDYVLPIPVKTALGTGRVNMPRTLVNVGAGITLNPPVAGQGSSITFNKAGDYEIDFGVSIVEAGQLQVELNGGFVPSSTSQRATGTSQIVIRTIVSVLVGDVLSIINPVGNATPLTVEAADGNMTHASGATLRIKNVR